MSGQRVLPEQDHAEQATLPSLWWSREFPGRAEEAGRVRHWIKALLPKYDPKRDPLDDLAFIAGELAANAVTHTRSALQGAVFNVQLAWSGEWARVVVGDSGSHSVPRPPKVVHASDEGGRGLLAVGELSAKWGTCGGADGRWVWADVWWASKDGPLLPSSGNLVAAEEGTLRRAFPGTCIWFGCDTRTWWALPPKATTMIGAPSPPALRQMLAAIYPESCPAAADPSRFVAAPVGPAAGFPPGTG
jgi:serine/threonine-protein kinase RsbW